MELQAMNPSRNGLPIHGRASIENLFEALCTQYPRYDLEKEVMEKVLDYDSTIIELMERGLLPDLCSMLRRTFGLSKSDRKAHRRLDEEMSSCYNAARMKRLDVPHGPQSAASLVHTHHE